MEETLIMAAAGESETTASQKNPSPAPAAAEPAGAGVATRPQEEEEAAAAAALSCPRCKSTNTKFCHYNNYTLVQPRYFCKTCRRYWTEGGSLGPRRPHGRRRGSRKDKRSSSASTSAAVSGAIPVDLNQAFPHHGGCALQQPPVFAAFPSRSSSGVCNDPGAGTALSAMELLRSTGGYVPLPLQHVQLGMPAEYAAAGFRMPPPRQFHGLLGFSLDTHAGTGYSSAGLQESAGGRLLFPFEDLKPAGGGANNNVQLGRMPAEYATAGFALGFSLDTHAGTGCSSAGLQGSAGGRLLFPFEDLNNPVVNAARGGDANNNGSPTADQYENSKEHQAAGDGSGVTGGHDDTAGFWSNSILGNGTSNGGGGPW
ncbi:unnamed protein product [Urochloa decumbens]|uniref:Dof zinc finger protein n=1 Tax=Urochloa decumbens TaxID=240449 RepID=A0ABC9AN01_9POAL